MAYLSERLQARNTALASENKIHDDEVARAFGFAGGLVPGVDVYAYLTRLPVQQWGEPWLARGTIEARFHKPVYDGEEVEVCGDLDGAGGLALELRNERGDVCATGAASLPALATPPPDPESLPAAPLPRPDDRPAAAPEAFEIGAVLGSEEFGFHADRAGDYLVEIGETVPIYAREGLAHPGWLLRSANRVLAANVRLGPWIHVESAVRHHATVPGDAQLSTRARVRDCFERKGHRFVVLDVLIVADGHVPVLSAEHIAIYEPRPVSDR